MMQYVMIKETLALEKTMQYRYLFLVFSIACGDLVDDIEKEEYINSNPVKIRVSDLPQAPENFTGAVFFLWGGLVTLDAVTLVVREGTPS